jgi:hypothetical protein
VELCTRPTAARIEDLIQKLAEMEGKLGGGAAPGTSSPRAAAPQPAAPPQPARRTTPRAEMESDPPRASIAAPAITAPAVVETVVPEAIFANPALRLVESPSSVHVAGDADPVVRWRNAVDRVKERKLLLGTCLEEGFFLGMAGTNVRIALSGEHAFHRAMLELKENREILNEELERWYGRGARLVCESTIPPGAEPLGARAESPRPDPAPPDAGRPAPVIEASLVDRIVELFDGEVMGPGPEEGNA